MSVSAVKSEARDHQLGKKSSKRTLLNLLSRPQGSARRFRPRALLILERRTTRRRRAGRDTPSRCRAPASGALCLPSQEVDAAPEPDPCGRNEGNGCAIRLRLLGLSCSASRSRAHDRDDRALRELSSAAAADGRRRRLWCSRHGSSVADPPLPRLDRAARPHSASPYVRGRLSPGSSWTALKCSSLRTPVRRAPSRFLGLTRPCRAAPERRGTRRADRTSHDRPAAACGRGRASRRPPSARSGSSIRP
jgi:hypothetical protein